MRLASHDGSQAPAQPIPHARQQPVELLVAQLDLPREELTDARLPHPTETRQLRLAGTRVEHDLATPPLLAALRGGDHTAGRRCAPRAWLRRRAAPLAQIEPSADCGTTPRSRRGKD